MRKYIPVIMRIISIYYMDSYVFIDIKMIRIGFQYAKMKITYVQGHTNVSHVKNTCVIIWLFMYFWMHDEIFVWIFHARKLLREKGWIAKVRTDKKEKMSTDSTSTSTTYGTISKSFNGISNPKPNGKSEISPIIENRPKNNKSKIRNKSYPQRNDRVEITKFNSNPSTPITKSSMIFAHLALLLSWLLHVDTILKDPLRTNFPILLVDQ